MTDTAALAWLQANVGQGTIPIDLIATANPSFELTTESDDILTTEAGDILIMDNG